MANKPEWLAQRSAAIPIFIEDNLLKVVLVTTKPKAKQNWIFPKGEVELNMTEHESAAKEAFEEAGVAGRISKVPFDEYTHKKWGGQSTVNAYLLEVTKIYDVWMEMHERERKIVSLDEAIELVQAHQQETLRKLRSTLFEA